MDQSNQYLTEVEVSRMTHFSVQTLRNNRFKRRGIPYHKIGKSIRYKLVDVINIMDSGRIEVSSISGNLKTVKEKGGIKS
jgi:hypothetical protein